MSNTSYTTLTINNATDIQQANTLVDQNFSGTYLYVVNDGPLDFSGASNGYANLGGISGSGDISLGSAVLTIYAPYYQSYSGVISGNADVDYSATGTWVLTGANSFTGSLVINSGVVQFGNGGVTGSVAGGIIDDSTLVIDLGGYNTLSNTITGNGALTITGSGTTVITANDLFSGVTTVSAGNLQIGNGGTTGSLAGDVAVTGATSSVIFDLGGTNTYAKSISSAGGLTQAGSGTLILTGYQTYTGTTVVQAGILALQGGGDLQNSAGLSISAGAEFDISGGQYYNGVNGLNGAAGAIVQLGANTLTLYDDANDVYAGTIVGTGGITEQGTGTLTLTGSLNYSGRTVINGGTLQLGNGAAAPGTVGDIVDDSNLIFDYSGYYEGTISGSGAVTVQGGTLAIGTKQTYSGQTTIASGVLRLDDGGSISGPIVIDQNAGLVFNHSDYIAEGGPISGAGSIVQEGAGDLELSGSNTYTGGTIIGGGTLELADGAAAGSGAISFTAGDAGTLLFDTDTQTGLIENFTVGDTIDVRQIGLADTATVTASGLVVSGSSGSLTLNLANIGTYASSQFQLSADGAGGTKITMTSASSGGGATGTGTTGTGTTGSSGGGTTTGTGSGTTTGGASTSDGYTAVLSSDSSTLSIYAAGSTTPTTIAVGQEATLNGGTAIADPTGAVGEIARLYQAAFDRTPDLAGINYWIGQANAGETVSQMATYFASSPEFLTLNNGTGSNQTFVDTLYQNVLGRAADTSGESYWVNALATGTLSRGAVLEDFAQSQENISNTTGLAGDPNSSEVTQLYQAAFDRAPDLSGLAFWTQAMANGSTALQIAQTFTSTAEFQSDFTGLDNAGFVNQLYVHVFGQAGDAAGIQYWTNAMASGETRAQVLLGFADSLQNRQQTAAQTHAGWVFIQS